MAYNTLPALTRPRAARSARSPTKTPEGRSARWFVDRMRPGEARAATVVRDRRDPHDLVPPNE